MLRVQGLFARIVGGAYGHPKVNSAWRANRGALGLQFLALSFCADQLTDGHVPAWFVEEKLPNARERKQIVTALEDQGLWEKNGSGWVIHDYAEVNATKAELEAERERRSAAGAKAAKARWE